MVIFFRPTKKKLDGCLPTSMILPTSSKLTQKRETFHPLSHLEVFFKKSTTSTSSVLAPSQPTPWTNSVFKQTHQRSNRWVEVSDLDFLLSGCQQLTHFRWKYPRLVLRKKQWDWEFASPPIEELVKAQASNFCRIGWHSEFVILHCAYRWHAKRKIRTVVYWTQLAALLA